MRRVLIAGFASLLALALIAWRHRERPSSDKFRSTCPLAPRPRRPRQGGRSPSTSSSRTRGATRRSSRRDSSPGSTSRRCPVLLQRSGQSHRTPQLLLTTTLQTKIKLKKKAPVNPAKSKPGRYNFNFSYKAPAFTGNFPTFTGTLTGTIDKPNGAAKPRFPRSPGSLDHRGHRLAPRPVELFDRRAQELGRPSADGPLTRAEPADLPRSRRAAGVGRLVFWTRSGGHCPHRAAHKRRSEILRGRCRRRTWRSGNRWVIGSWWFQERSPSCIQVCFWGDSLRWTLSWADRCFMRNAVNVAGKTARFRAGGS